MGGPLHADAGIIREFRRERTIARRRLLAFAAGVLFFVFGVIGVEAALVSGLMRVGMPFVFAMVIVALLNLAVAIAAVYFWGRRRESDGPPFAITKNEFSKAVAWVDENFRDKKNVITIPRLASLTFFIWRMKRGWLRTLINL